MERRLEIKEEADSRQIREDRRRRGQWAQDQRLDMREEEDDRRPHTGDQI